MLAGLTGFSAAGDASRSNAPIPGYLDPKTGTFTAAPEGQPNAPAVTTIVVTGKVKIVASVKFVSSLPAGTTFQSGGSIDVENGGVVNHIHGNATVTRTGATGTATVTFPYRFRIAARPAAIKVGFYIGANTSTGQFTQLRQIVSLPANGTTVTVNFPASL